MPPTDSAIKYVILCFDLVFCALSKFVKCKKCNDDIEFLQQKDRGLGFKICPKCSCKPNYIESSPVIDKNNNKINQRIVFVMRVLGIGYNGLQMFLSLMDISTYFSKGTYYNVISKIHNVSKKCFDFVTKKRRASTQ